MMKVSVKLFATLARNASGAILAEYPQGIPAAHPVQVELPQSSTLADLVDYLGLPREQVRITFVNGRAQGLDHPLAAGDEIGIFPPIGGG
jgi:molybdopterin converting factor small subunit